MRLLRELDGSAEGSDVGFGSKSADRGARKAAAAPLITEVNERDGIEAGFPCGEVVGDLRSSKKIAQQLTAPHTQKPVCDSPEPIHEAYLSEGRPALSLAFSKSFVMTQHWR